ncbi:hypothetical protein A0H81_13299 [Grifola frondosa]|uniref:Sugar phosphate transporter domain-containing protein n=1 Tax=Grifola frondosa TaxID=5627 RepID=A0A1C7LQE9_GRIFR|nr:hypothetical protein A0H81_13299 [Grifola frondosa]
MYSPLLRDNTAGFFSARPNDSPRIFNTPFFAEPKAFPPVFTPEVTSGWRSFRIQEDFQSHEAANPPPQPSSVSWQKALSGHGSRHHPEDVMWPDFSTLQHKPNLSPRQRTGFPRATPGVLLESVPLSPLVSEGGFPSPSLPILSPHASASSKRLIRKNRKGDHRLAFVGSQIFWLALYFSFNLGLTLYNKGVLARFPFPYTLTAIHALCGSIGGLILTRRGFYIPARLDMKSYVVLAGFSVLYAVNIAFHQVVRAATPVFTTMLSIAILGTKFSRIKLLTLVPVIAGVILATYGDYYFTAWGFFLTLLGTFLAALKTISTNVLQSAPLLTTKGKLPANRYPARTLTRLQIFLPSRLHLHPLDLLTRMSPLAFLQCIMYAYATGEFERMRTFHGQQGGIGWTRSAILLGNGLIAFGLNVVSFTANGRVGALNMTVAGTVLQFDILIFCHLICMRVSLANVKQVLTIVLAVAIFDLTITSANAMGILVTLAGGALYAWVEYADKMDKKRGKRALTQMR